jgi:hypothetical protein
MPKGGGLDMLGPALTELFTALDGRKDSQTSYEKHLYQELLVLKMFGDSLAEAPLGGFSAAGGMAASLPADLALQGIAKFSRPFLENIIVGPRNPGLENIVVGPRDPGGSEPIRLQVNCENPTCPNKEFK